MTPNSLEIVKFKSKRANKKQVFLISNDNCITVDKKKAKNKTVNELLIDDINVNQIGKILIDNGKFLTIQKGRPYFFPNCKTENSKEKIDLQYKLIKANNYTSNFKTDTFINYSDITEQSLVERVDPNKKLSGRKIKFSKMLIKKNGKFYSSPIPFFLNNFTLVKKNQETKRKNK